MNRHIAVHFVWTIGIAVACFKVGDVYFQAVLMFNAAFAVVIAVARKETLRLRRLTLWDEAVAFMGVSAVAHFIR
jgi:hypothetical protein